MVKVFLDAKTAEKVVLLSGPVERDSPCPRAGRAHLRAGELDPPTHLIRAPSLSSIVPLPRSARFDRTRHPSLKASALQRIPPIPSPPQRPSASCCTSLYGWQLRDDINTAVERFLCPISNPTRGHWGGVFNLTLLLVGATHRPAVHVEHASLGDSNAAAGERPNGLRAATPRPRALTDCGSCALHMRTNVASPMHALPAYRPARDCSPAQAKTRLCSAQVLNRPWSPRSSCLASLTQWLRTGAVVELQRRPAGARLRELCGTVGNKTTRDFAQSLTNSWFIS